MLDGEEDYEEIPADDFLQQFEDSLKSPEENKREQFAQIKADAEEKLCSIYIKCLEWVYKKERPVESRAEYLTMLDIRARELTRLIQSFRRERQASFEAYLKDNGFEGDSIVDMIENP